MPWQETQPFFLLFWQEFRIEEEGEEEGQEDEDDIRDSWLFSTREDALIFLGERILETITMNQDHLPPAVVRSIQEALTAGDIWDTASDLYVEAMSEFLGSDERIFLDEVNLMVRT